MGLLDFLFDKDAAQERKREKCRKKLTNMYYQKADRLAAAEIAAEMVHEGDTDAVGVLLERFEHQTPSQTIDREEKEYVHDLLVDLGERVVEPIQRYVQRTDNSVYWPMRVLGELLSTEKFEAFIGDVLEATDNAYTREPAKKIALIQLADDHLTDRIAAALEPLTDDHSEQVRFQAIDTLLKSGRDGVHEVLLLRLAGEEESVRILNRIAEVFIERDWGLGEHEEAVKSHLPDGFRVGKNGKVTRG